MNSKIQNLINKLDTSKDLEAEKVIQKLVLYGEDAILQLIDAAENESKPRVRKWSLQALGAIGNPKGAKPLLSALLDQRMTVRLHAIRGLARMKYKASEKNLVKLLKDDSGGIRVNTIDALIAISAKKSNKELIRCLSDESWYVRQHAARACGILKIKEAIKKLKLLETRETRKAVKQAVNISLKQLEKWR